MRYTITVLLMSLIMKGFGQSPALINYQGIARDASGNPVASQAIALKFEILQGSATGPVVYTDNQPSGNTTNAYGLFTTQIGKNGTLGGVDWQGGPYFLRVSIDPSGGTNLVSLGAQQMISVPFARHAESVPSTYTNNILTIGTHTHAINSGTAVTVAQGSGTNITVSSGPNYTISYVPPTLALTPNNASISIVGSNTIALPASITPTITPSGIATVTNGASTYTVGVPAPIYNPINGVLSFGSNNTTVTPTLVLNNGVLYSGPPTNSVSIPTGVTVSGIGLASVTNGPNYVVNVSPPTLALSSNNLSLSIVGSNSVAFPAGVTVAAPAANMVNVAGGPTNYTVSVPNPAFTGTALTIGATSTTIAPTLLFSSGILTSGVSTNSVNLSNIGPWVQSGTSLTLATMSNDVSIGSNAASAKLDIFSSTGGNVLKVNDGSASNASPAAVISSSGVKSLFVTNTSANGVGGDFTSTGGYALSAQNSSSLFPTIYANNTSLIAGSSAGYFKGGLSAVGNGATSADFALRVNNSASANLFMVRNDGNIGIGTSAPIALLNMDVQSQTVTGIYMQNSRDVVGSAFPAAFDITTAGQTFGTDTYGRILRLSNSVNNNLYDFGIDGSGALFLSYFGNYTSPYFSMTPSGNIGIGTSVGSIVSKLDVNGNLRLNGGSLYLGGVGGINSGYTGLYSNASGDLTFSVFKSGGSATTFAPAGNSMDAMVVKVNTGNVGIGTASPAQKLDVIGSVKITDGTQALGNVLTSDATGNASWQPVTITTANTFTQQSLGTVTTASLNFPTSLTTFTKVNSDTKIEVIIQTHIYVSNLVGSNSVTFEVRLGNTAASGNSGKVNYFINNGGSLITANYKSVTIVAEFTGSLPAGGYTVDMYAYAVPSGSATSPYIDPGNFGTNSVIIKEYR